MRRSLVVAFLLTLVKGAGATSQSLDDALVPRGHLRVQVNPIFTTWDSRFGRNASGVTGEEALGEDLTTTSAESLFPGAETLRSQIEAMSGVSGYTPIFGETVARVSSDVTRVELGGHVGVFDWLTLGAILPWTRTHTSVDVAFEPDTLGGDLGLNPTVTDAGAVSAFLQALSSAEASAGALAAQECSISPGSPACTSAQSLADRAVAFGASATAAYGASAFFPFLGSPVALSLVDSLEALDTDLVGAGLPGVVTPMVFATQWVDQQNFFTLPTSDASGVLGAPLGSVDGLWRAGDAELSATALVLDGRVQSPTESVPRFTYRLLATVLARLPTGSVDSVDVFLDVGTGDGQADFEARLQGGLTIGSRIGILGGARYGIQRPRTLVRRVARPEVILAPYSSRQLVEWSPGSYWGLEIAPGFRITGELSIAAEYRVLRKYRDSYRLTSPGAPVDPLVLEEESGVTLHEVGGTFRYDTVARWLGGDAPRPLQLHARWLRAVAGGGGQTPVTTRVEFSVRLFRRLWGSG